MDNQLKPILYEIESNLANAESPLFAVFDFDNTCIEHDIQQALIAHMCRHGLLRNNQSEDPEKIFTHYYEMLGQGITVDTYRYAAATLKGFHIEEIPDLVSKIIIEEGEEIGTTELFGIKITKGLRVEKNIRELMEKLISLGIKIWVISSSPETVVKAALHHFKFPNVECLAMKSVIVDGVLTEKTIELAPAEKGKMACIKKYINETTAPILGAGDSMNDLAMLEYSHIRVVVDRNNKLTDEAHRRGWHVLKTFNNN